MDRPGRGGFLPWGSIEARAPTAFTVAGASLLASLIVPFGLAVVVDWSWLVGLALVGVGVVAAAVSVLGLHGRASTASPRVAGFGTAFASTAGLVGLVVLGLAAVTGAAIYLPTVEFSVGKPAFVVLSLTMAAGYGLGFLGAGIGLLRSSDPSRRAAWLLAAGGTVLLVPVGLGLLQLGLGIAMPAWVVFAAIGLVAVDTVAVGVSLRPG